MKLEYKKVKRLVAHCGDCKEELQGNSSIISPYKCSCGEWEFISASEYKLKKEIAKVGDTIEWSFPDNDDYPKHFRGNTFEAEVGVVNQDKKEYGVYAEYGQDYIGFNDCKIIKRK